MHFSFSEIKTVILMNLIREGLPVDESTYIKSTQAMQKMQEITDRLAVNTPDLNKCQS